MRLSTIRREAANHGLVVRGSFVPDAADRVPPLSDGRNASSVVLLGNVGASLWDAFSNSPEYRDGAANPLDRWSQRIGTALAESFGADVLFPFGGPPYHPFIRWALRAEDVTASKLGMLIHPQYGLWHAYRFALLFAEALADQATLHGGDSPCLHCSAKPCLSACPVGAFSESGYDVSRCVEHLAANEAASCNHRGCLARIACPVGPTHRYPAPQARFHMKAFLAARLSTHD